MRRISIGAMIAICLLAASVVVGDAPEVVSHPPSALNATMTLSTNAAGLPVWTVQGKVSPHFRGYGATVHLLFTPYNDLLNGVPPSVLPPQACDTLVCPSDVDSCGNFSFQITPNPNGPVQLPNYYFAVFVVHVDPTKTPQPCSNGTPVVVSDPIVDPNGSAPCSGGFCPTAP